MQLDFADGKIIKITTQTGVYFDSDYDLGTTTKGNFFAAVGKKPENNKTLVLIPVTAVTAIFMEVSDAEQQNAIESPA